ncbi:hypothetical protein [Nostoc sp. FACHB-110]|uniref:hypothetical protein n=1 Tax=Nostoc sp. FACHB-110 TaxID=2692834 RepID=UPI00168849CC|nr:hypothetical protein [Nostoc sp. FACHB-110]MBD2441341.1 hypothetical protein [Nostoc sp. FACHB-110]
MRIANCFGWQYGLLRSKNSKDIIYLPESEIQQLSPQESEEEILTEIDEHLNQVAMLQAQLGILHSPQVKNNLAWQNLLERSRNPVILSL